MNHSGKFVKNLTGKLSYQSFKPSNLPPNPKITIGDVLDKKIKDSYHLLGKLNDISKLISNKDLYISMYVRKEALLSSQIEGAQATLDDIFDSHLDQNMNLDVEEVIQLLKGTKPCKLYIAIEISSVAQFKSRQFNLSYSDVVSTV